MTIHYAPLCRADSEAFFRLAGDERVAATMRFDCPRTRAQSDQILEDYLAGETRTFALRFAPMEPLWGIFSFKVSPDSPVPSLSEMMVPEQWGRGLGAQVLHDMLALARKEQWYPALEGYVLESNTASRRMALSNGFREAKRLRFDGMTEDLVVYQLCLRESCPKRSSH